MRALLGIFLALTAGGSLAATALPAPSVAYSAERVYNPGSDERVVAVRADSKRLRMEYLRDGVAHVEILRADEEVQWHLLPEQRVYDESGLLPVDIAMQGLTSARLNVTPDGQETIDGVEATRYRIGNADGSLKGRVWLNDHQIVIGMEVEVHYAGKRVRQEMRLRNLRLVGLDDELFRVPAGYREVEDVEDVLD